MNTVSLRFHRLSILTALLFFVLAAVWMFIPEKALAGWGVGFNDAVGLVSRRAAAMYAGIGVMFWLVRNAPQSAGRSALVSGFVTACLIIACLGMYELASGHANAGILIAVCIEIILSVAFIAVSRIKQ